MTKRDRDVRLETLERDTWQCQACQSQNRRILTVHHIKRLSDGGADDITNCITLCSPCHKKIEILYDQKKYNYLSFYQWLEKEWRNNGNHHQ